MRLALTAVDPLMASTRSQFDIEWRSGVCGGRTTFSTLQLELPQMLDGEHTGLAVAYGSVSILAGFLAVAVTTNLGSGRTALAASPFSTAPSAWPLASVRPGRADA